MSTTDTPLGDIAAADRARIVRAATDRLTDEFRGILGRETIERFIDDSLDRLSISRYHDFVPLLAERFARERLRAVARLEGRIASDRPTVLFLCVHNAGRSQMAAGWLSHLAGDRVEVLSGGSEPADGVNPAAVAAMAEVGIDISDSFPRPWTDETVGVADVIVSMGCGDACPVLPGKRYLDWDLEDPAGRGVEAVRPIRDDIEQRVRGLMAELGVTVA
jgi:arsenate reductase